MTDEYVKTLVIRDADYRPGDAFAPTPDSVDKTPPPHTKTPENETIQQPDFSDTSWLT